MSGVIGAVQCVGHVLACRLTYPECFLETLRAVLLRVAASRTLLLRRRAQHLTKLLNPKACGGEIR